MEKSHLIQCWFLRKVTKIISVKDADGVSKLIDMVPDVVNKFGDKVGDKFGKKETDTDVADKED